MKLLHLVLAIPLLLLGACSTPQRLTQEEALQRIEQWAADSTWQPEHEVLETPGQDGPEQSVVRLSVEVDSVAQARHFFSELKQFVGTARSPLQYLARISWPQDHGQVLLQVDVENEEETPAMWQWATAALPEGVSSRRVGWGDTNQLAAQQEALTRLIGLGQVPSRYRGLKVWFDGATFEELGRALDVLGQEWTVHNDRVTLTHGFHAPSSYPFLAQLDADPAVQNLIFDGAGGVEFTADSAHCLDALARCKRAARSLWERSHP